KARANRSFYPEAVAGQDVLPHTRARSGFDLPEEADGASDRPGRIGRTDVVEIDDIGRRHRNRIAHGWRAGTYRQQTHRLIGDAGCQHNGLIGELQPLEVGEAVGAVEKV